MPNAPVAICRHLSSGTLMGDKPVPLGISKIQMANRYIRASLPLKCPPSLLHDPARVLPICFSVDEEPSDWY